VLLSLHVNNVLQVHVVICVSLHVFEVFVQDEFNPDLTDFLVNSTGSSDISFFLVVLSKVEVAGAKFGGLRPVHFALPVNSFSQIFEGILVRATSLSGQEESSESDLEVSLVTFEFRVGHEVTFVLRVSSLVVLIRGEFQQIPESSDQEFFSFLEAVSSHTDVGLSEHEIGGEKLNTLFVEDSFLNLVVHALVDKGIGSLNLSLNDKLLGLHNSLVDFIFLKLKFG
jgi:hypothetical protein